jgi:AraC-like DNA-binding protein
MDEVATTDPGVARRWLEATYAGYRPEKSSSHRDFSFRSRRVRVGSGSLARLRYSLSADNGVVLSDVLVVVHPDEGGMKVSMGRHEEAVLQGSPVLLPAHQVVSVLWADTMADCVGVRTADVERIAVETTGLEGIALRFTGLRPMSPALGRRWSDTVHRVVDVLVGHPDVAAAPLVATALTQRLARAALETFPSTTLVSHPRLPLDHATPAVVRRASEHIEANAHQVMTLTGIADAAGLGVRGLQAAFLRHQDTTPTAYAERVRMARAHRDLVDTDSSGPDSVPTIAARWGFADHRRFAAAYRDTYGRLPEETLRR